MRDFASISVAVMSSIVVVAGALCSVGCNSDPEATVVDAGSENDVADTSDASPVASDAIELSTDFGWIEWSSSTRRLFVSLTLKNISADEPIPADWSEFRLVTAEDETISPSQASADVDHVCQDVTLSTDESLSCEVAFDLGTQDEPDLLRYVGVDGVTVETDITYEEGFEDQWESYCDFAMTQCGLDHVELVVPDGSGFQFSVDFYDHSDCMDGMNRMLNDLQNMANCTRREARTMLDYYAACSMDMGCDEFSGSSYGYSCLYDTHPPETCDAD